MEWQGCIVDCMKFDVRSLRSKRKFDRGETPCGNCDSNHHQSCRPRLDGTLCTCSCPRSCQWREATENCGGDIEAARDYMDKGWGRAGKVQKSHERDVLKVVEHTVNYPS